MENNEVQSAELDEAKSDLISDIINNTHSGSLLRQTLLRAANKAFTAIRAAERERYAGIMENCKIDDPNNENRQVWNEALDYALRELDEGLDV